MLKGIDVSQHRGVIDWAKAKAAGVQFAIIRMGYGSNILSNANAAIIDEYEQDDPQFEPNVAGCEANGIPWGAYLYSYATNLDEAKSEVEHILRLLKGKKPTYPIVLDMEDTDHYKQNHNVSPQMWNDIVFTVCSSIEAAGFYSMYYANKYDKEHILTDSRLNRYDFYLAEWNDTDDYTGQHGLWQNGHDNINGISGSCDTDQTTGYRDYPAYIKQNGLNGWPAGSVKPTPTPAPTPTPPNSSDLIYTVVSGDTLSGIAAKYNTTYQVLANYNGISDPSKIYLGQKIRIPGAGPAPKPSGWDQRGPNPSLIWDNEYDAMIADLQRILNAKGTSLPVNGIAGTSTYNAVKGYTINKGDAGPLTKWVQQRLTYEGCKCTINGTAGADTLSAIKSFQQYYKLGVGYLGGTDWYYLIR